MNDLYIHQLETENKQLREALQECRKALEEQQQENKQLKKIYENALAVVNKIKKYENNQIRKDMEIV